MSFDPSIFWRFLFYGPIVHGAELTVVLAIASQALGIVIGLFLALSRLSRGRLPIFRGLAGLYIWFFRGTPLLVQIIFIYDGLPQITHHAVVLDAVPSALIALSLNEGAYMAEIIRAGIQAVASGQMEAAKALGMTYPKAMRRIIIPQAVRFIIPPTANELISMLKNTSLAVVIAAPELLYNVQEVYDANFDYFELLTVASVWYLAMTTVATYIQAKLERRLEYTPRTRLFWNTLLGRRGFGSIGQSGVPR
ncbi:MAG: amino acid ABC transporter permease [Chloroflexota bacterium]